MKNWLKKELVIIDDVYPHPRSIDTWRGVEFEYYLKKMDNVSIYTNFYTIHLLGNETSEEIMNEFQKKRPHFFRAVKKIDGFYPPRLFGGTLVYSIFLNNIYSSLDYIEEKKVPFVFELYPGGMFLLNDEESDRKLSKVCSSYYFRGVIVSSVVTYNYLINHRFCDRDKVHLVLGCVINQETMPKKTYKKKRYGFDKKYIDIAFAAYRYTEQGEDKGYDIFIELAKELCSKVDNCRFHVVGNFDERVIDITEIKDKITFYGAHEAEWFNEFYQDKDLFLSLNKSNTLHKGAFDGFPTGCAMDAILRKTATICSDDLEQNAGQYKNGEEIIIIDSIETEAILKRLFELYNNPNTLAKIGEAGAAKGRVLYSEKTQLKSREGVLRKYMK